MKSLTVLVIFVLTGSLFLSGCSTAARDKRQQKRELKAWKDDGKSRWQKLQEWEDKKGDAMWEKFQSR